MSKRRSGSGGDRGGRWLAAASVLLLLGCSDTATEAPQAARRTPIDLSTTGTIQVEVRFTGSVPQPAELNLRAVPACAAIHPGPVYDRSLVVADGRVANTVVWIKEGLANVAFASLTDPVIIDQKGCIYEPRVVAAMVSQPVRFLNSDPEPHNVRGQPKLLNAWNFMMSRQNSSRTLQFDKPEVGIPVGCDIHPWMRAYLSVFDHPYFAVTAADGSATLRQVPPGAYTVATWHERLGSSAQQVALEPRGTATVRVTYPTP